MLIDHEFCYCTYDLGELIVSRCLGVSFLCRNRHLPGIHAKSISFAFPVISEYLHESEASWAEIVGAMGGKKDWIGAMKSLVGNSSSVTWYSLARNGWTCRFESFRPWYWSWNHRLGIMEMWYLKSNNVSCRRQKKCLHGIPEFTSDMHVQKNARPSVNATYCGRS
ncbi:hypothetical protein B0O80DRAFT_29436 [Mortierella sp. GBAus27b]|nr:hypothetical protein B0O80DRAFT_29436 [Mortierella sp. GBAus27b]